MNDWTFTTGAILSSISHTKDGSLRLGFITQELQVKEKLIAIEQLQKFGYLLFKPNMIQESDIPKAQVEDTNKTPSKRLRNTIYVYWQQSGSKQDFERFYVEKMEKLINMVKDKLD